MKPSCTKAALTAAAMLAWGAAAAQPPASQGQGPVFAPRGAGQFDRDGDRSNDRGPGADSEPAPNADEEGPAPRAAPDRGPGPGPGGDFARRPARDGGFRGPAGEWQGGPPRECFLFSRQGWGPEHGPAFRGERRPGTERERDESHRPAPGMELAELLRNVAAVSGRQFLVDGRVPRHIAVRGTDLDHPTYALLLSILRLNGLAAVELGGRVNVVPAEIIRQYATPIVERDDANVPDDAWVSRVVKTSVNPASLVPILRPLMPRPAHLVAHVNADGTGGTVLIVDLYANVKRITQLIGALTQADEQAPPPNAPAQAPPRAPR